MNYAILSDLNDSLQKLFGDLHGRTIDNTLFDELADALNSKVHAIYKKHGMKLERKLDRDFVIYLFNLLVQTGAIEVYDDKLGVPSVEEDDAPLSKNAAHKYDPVAAEQPTVEANSAGVFPDGWGDNLNGNFDAEYWAKEFAILAELKPEWTSDVSYLTGWFANAIMTGYDKAKQEEFPVAEHSDEDYVYVEFFDTIRDEFAPRTAEINNIVLKFNTLAAAKEFVKLNAFSDAFKTKYYRYYTLEPTTTLKKTELK